MASLEKHSLFHLLLPSSALFRTLLSLLVAFSGLGAGCEGQTLDAVFEHLAGSGLSRKYLAVLSWREQTCTLAVWRETLLEYRVTKEYR